MSEKPSAALPIAHKALRLLIVLNWLSGAAILALLTATIVSKDWTLKALGFPPDDPIHGIMAGLRMIAALGVAAVPIYHLILSRLLAIVGTVRTGDPFVPVNADHLYRIAWGLLVLQIFSLIIGGIGEAISTPAAPLHLDAGFSPGGWMAVLLTFVLSRIFSEGTRMRDDLEGTV